MKIFKIVVTSDTHGNELALEKLILNNQNTDLIIHLGDGENEFFKMKNKFQQLNMLMVKGNCDFNLNKKLPNLKIIKINKFKIMACHGHQFNVKQNLKTLQIMAQNLKINLVLFGHTHIKHLKKLNEIMFFNPGSLTLPRAANQPSFGIINIANKIDIEILNF